MDLYLKGGVWLWTQHSEGWREVAVIDRRVAPGYELAAGKDIIDVAIQRTEHCSVQFRKFRRSYVP